MLGGKHFRRRQQRTLIARVDHLQHRQHRHDGLARADLALQHAVHRAGRLASSSEITVEHLLLAGGQLERQPLASSRPRARLAPRRAVARIADSSPCRRLTSAHCSPTASSKRQPVAGPLAFVVVLGQVDRAQRLVLGDQIVLRAETLPAADPATGSSTSSTCRTHA